jgi:hypothetical protein
MIRLKIVLLTALVFFFAASALATENPLASKKLTAALAEEVSGENAFNYTAQISRFDRVQASEGFHDAAEMIKKELEAIGYKDVVLEGWPSNGTRRYYTYRSVIGWRAKKGELWLVSPARERLCSYEEIPLTLVKHSNSANVRAELIDVGTGIGEDAYRNRDVKGKIVLATGYTGEVMREAVLKRGALGIVTWFSPETRPGYPNMIRYTAIWPRWEERDKIGFGFNVSKNQGAVLKSLLEEGKKVVLKAEVEAEFYESQLEVLSAAFPGNSEPEREVTIIGHLCHPRPSANDNASGSGGMLEMARALKTMVGKGLIEPPKRTIRFLWVPEFAGTIPYVQAYLKRTRNTLAVINCDMIGEDFHKTGGMFNIFCTPDSMPSYLNDVVVNFTKLAESLDLKSINGSDHPFAYKVYPFSGGSDHYVFNDGALRVPSVMLNRGDTFHHTSLDSIDKVDPTELRRACFIALGSVYYLANAGDIEAREMARLISRNGLGRLSEDYYDSLPLVLDAKTEKELVDGYKQVLNVIEQSSFRENQSAVSPAIFTKDNNLKEAIKGFTGHLKILSASLKTEAQKIYEKNCQRLGVKSKPMSLTGVEKEMSRIVPLRAESFVCPLEADYLVEKLGPSILNEIKLKGYQAYEAINFVDGKRNVLEIAKAVSAEYGPVEILNVYDFFKILEKAELVQLAKMQ